jgi:predicted RNA binding protein YcfA (HicA-like mRNA interferase family)
MSPRLPRLTAREVRRVLEAHGFQVVRQRGSHMDNSGLTEADFTP